MDLYVESFRIEDGTRRQLLLSGIAGQEDLRVHFDLLGEHDPPHPELLDGFVSAVVFLAMEQAQPLRVHGAVSRQFLINLAAFQEAWAALLPERYRRVDVLPAEVRSRVAGGPPAAIAAFSGGVDATFALHHHLRGDLGLGAIPIEAALFVQFDFHRDKGSPDRLIDKVRPVVEKLGIEFRTMRTDIREGRRQSWIDAHAAMMGACLYNFAHRYGIAVAGGAAPYWAMVMPAGSNPATDPLLSSPAMQMFHDGAAFSRTEKLLVIARDESVRKALQVCLKRVDENCGRCRKCLRTRLNFMAAGIDAPECFAGDLELEWIDGIRIRSEMERSELKSILDHARSKQVAAEWTKRLERRLSRNDSLSTFDKMTLKLRRKFRRAIG